MTIIVVYSEEPSFPASDQQPEALRAEVGSYWVDYLGVAPTAPEVLEFLAPSDSYTLYKSTIVRRLTEQEAVVLTAVLDGAPVKSKMLWNASEWLDSADPLFTTLEAAIAGALGEERAAEILAPEL